MMLAAAVTPAPPPRPSLWPLAVASGGTLATLWLLMMYPPAAALWAPLNVITAEATARMLDVFGLPVVREFTVLRHAGGFVCEIDTACTALVPAALLSATILAWRGSWPARLAGVTGAVLWLAGMNQLRLAGLVGVGVYAPAWFDLAHLWLGPAFLTAAAVGYALAWRRATRC